jgi:hypothetical protein
VPGEGEEKRVPVAKDKRRENTGGQGLGWAFGFNQKFSLVSSVFKNFGF